MEQNQPTRSIDPDLAALQKEKIRLEVLDLKRRGSWEDRIGKFIPLIASLVAVSGFFLTLWQAQQNEVLARESRERDRINRIQSQIRADKEQILEFITSDKVSSVRCAFLIDDLSSLTDQLPDRSAEIDRITDLLSKVVWELDFDERRDINFDTDALEKWPPLRERWKSNPEAHHGFLVRKYYLRMSQLHAANPKCVETLDYDEHTFTFSSSENTKECNEGHFAVLTYGFKAHLELLRETGNPQWLKRELEEFKNRTNNSPLAKKFSAKYGGS